MVRVSSRLALTTHSTYSRLLVKESVSKKVVASGDFAIASVALAVTANSGGLAVRVAIGGCGPKPVRLDEADALLNARFGDRAAATEAGGRLAEACDPVDDVRASADYRRLVVPRLVADTVAKAATMLEAR